MMGASAATQLQPQQQEKNRRVWTVERALDQARDLYERVTGALGIARKEKKTLRILELEPELAQAADALNVAARNYRAVTGVDAPLSEGPQGKPGTVNWLRSANPEFRSVDDEVARCEREINRLVPQIVQIEKAIAAQGVVQVFTDSTDANYAAERVLDSIYPERLTLRARNIDATQRKVQDFVKLQTQCAELKQQLEKATSERAIAMAKRDSMLAELLPTGKVR